MIFEGLEATERANKAALLLAHERYVAQYAPFVKGQSTRLAYLAPQISRMLEEVTKETNADLDYVAERFEDYLKESVKQKHDPKGLPDVLETSDEAGLEGIVKTDPMDRGEVPGAGREEALDNIPKQDLGEYSQKLSCVRCSKDFAAKKTTAVCLDCAKSIHKLAYGDDLAFTGEDMYEAYGENGPDEDDMDALNHMWDKDLGERIMAIQDQLSTEEDPQIRDDLFRELGELTFKRDTANGQLADEFDQDDQAEYDQEEYAERGLRGGKVHNDFLAEADRVYAAIKERLSDNTLDVGGYGTGVADGTENLVQPTNPNMPFVCTICGHQGSRDEMLAHVQQDHSDVLQRQQQGQPQQQPSQLPQTQPMVSKTAVVPDTEDSAKVEPLPTSPVDQFDEYVQDLANRAAARQFSMLSEDLIHSLSSQLGVGEDEIRNSAQVTAIFGDYVGVNGEVGSDPSPPEGYEEVSTNSQGQMDGRSALIPTDLLIAKVADDLNLEHDLAYNQIRDSMGADLPPKWNASVKGEQHIYLPTEIAGNQQQQQVDPEVGPTAPTAVQPQQQPQQY
jgi:hypothetical protein